MTRLVTIGGMILLLVLAALPAVALVAKNQQLTPTGPAASKSFEFSGQAQYCKNNPALCDKEKEKEEKKAEKEQEKAEKEQEKTEKKAEKEQEKAEKKSEAPKPPSRSR